MFISISGAGGVHHPEPKCHIDLRSNFFIPGGWGTLYIVHTLSNPHFSGGNWVSSLMSISLLRVSVRTFSDPWMYSNWMLKDLSSMAQLLTFELRVFFCRNLFNGKWSLLR